MPSPSVILDPTDDRNRVELVKLAQRYEFPQFVKEADLDTTMAPAQIAVTAYADPVRKKFACHNAAATWLSAVYFHEKSAEYHIKDRNRICDRFEKFADYFAIRPLYDAIVKKAEAMRGRDNLPDSSYAYVWESADGTKERYYPLDTTANIKVAAEWLDREKDAIPFRDRNVIANKILEKAAAKGAALGERLTDFVEKQAGRGIPDPPELYTMLERRAKLANSEQHREAITKLATAVKNTPRVALQPNELVKLATTVDIIDHAIGLKGKYTEILPRPEDVIFKVTYTKAASDYTQLCALQTGSIFGKEQLAKLAREDVEGLFGTDFANEVCTGLDVDVEKLATVAHTLPRPDAELLETLLGESGQYPQMNKSASFEPIDNATLEALAAAYQ
jgi:hypothetical protein